MPDFACQTSQVSSTRLALSVRCGVALSGIPMNQKVMGDRDWDDETGEYVEKYPRDDILMAIQECGGGGCNIRGC